MRRRKARRLVEQRPHPSHDRFAIRRSLACFAVAMLFLLGAGAGAWPFWLGGAGFLAASAVLVLTPINSCRCPACGGRLARPADTTEFPCKRCGVVWRTRVFGYSIRE
jgi:hypothetical protein